MTDTGPLPRYQLSASNRQAREFVTYINDGQMWLDAPYQRGLVWTADQQRGLVKTWLLGLPIPAIIYNDRNTEAWKAANGYDHRYAVIDGKQRLSAARAWFSGELAVPTGWFDPDHVESTIDVDGVAMVTFDRLTLAGGRLMANRALMPTVEARVHSVADEAAIHHLVNTGGTAQTKEDLARAEAIAAEGA